VLCAVPLAVVVPAIVTTVSDPVLPPGLAAQVTGVLWVGLALALYLGRTAAERPLAYLLAWFDGGGLAILLISLTILERYPGWLARGRTAFVSLHLVIAGAGFALLAAMTVLYRVWKRAERPDAIALFVAGLNVAYLFVPLVHHLFFSTDEGTWLDPDYFTYIPSADNYFARNAWVQIAVWLAVAGVALGISGLRAWPARRKNREIG
jgi:hypothetical protein